MARDWAHNCACDSYDDLVDQHIQEEQLKEAARADGDPVTLRGRVALGVRQLLSRVRR